MKIYEGFLPKGRESARTVYVTQNGAESDLLEHHVRHSPSGFSWGYQGSGPAELAMSILWDFLGYEPHSLLYQKFKDDFVARWDEDWVLASDAIEGWLERHKDIPRRANRSGAA